MYLVFSWNFKKQKLFQRGFYQVYFFCNNIFTLIRLGFLKIAFSGEDGSISTPFWFQEELIQY